MRLGRLVALGIGMSFVAAMLAQSRPSVEGQWAGGKYVVVVKHATTQSNRDEGSFSSESEYRFELKAQEPDANGQRLQVVFTRLVMRGKGGFMERLQRDTDKPAGDDRSSLQYRSKAMVGSPMEATIGPDGKARVVSGVDEIIRKAGASEDPGGAGAVRKDCDLAISTALTPLHFQFPNEPLAKGLAWSRNESVDAGMLGAVKIARNYKVKEVADTPDGSVAEIEIVTKTTSDKPVPTDEDSAKFAKIATVDEFAYEASGTIRVNLRTKMVVTSKLHSKTSVKGTSLLDGSNLPFGFVSESDSEVLVAPAKNTATSSTSRG